MKVLPNILGAWSVLLGAAGTVEAAVLLVAVHRRYLRNHESLTSGADGEVLLAVGLFVAVLAVSARAVSLVLAVALHQAKSLMAIPSESSAHLEHRALLTRLFHF